MNLVHYTSKRPDELPECGYVPSGMDEAGMMFYVQGNEIEWTDRTPTYWMAPDNVVKVVQDFDDGVVEVFIAERDFGQLRRTG